MQKLEPFTLAEVAEKITCPILVCHGERDTIVPVELAYKTFEKIASKDKELRIFNADEGGAEHCQVDAIQIITARSPTGWPSTCASREGDAPT